MRVTKRIVHSINHNNYNIVRAVYYDLGYSNIRANENGDIDMNSRLMTDNAVVILMDK
jgi:hypothetical protein